MDKKRTTIKDIAAFAGVTPAAVSKAFKGDKDISNETREKIFDIAEKLNYTPNEFAINLVKKESKFIGIVFPEFKDTLFGNILDGIYDILDKNSYTAFIYLTGGDLKKEITVIDYLIRKNVSGVILFSSFSKISDMRKMPHIKKLKKQNIPYILLDRNLSVGKHNYIGVNNIHGGEMIGKYLAEMNHKNILFVYGEDCITVDERYKGFLKGIHNVSDNISVSKFRKESPTAFEAGYNAIKSLQNDIKQFTAIFSASDSIAFGVIAALNELGINIPEDISVIGFDDLLFSKVIGLTTVWYDREELGKQAADIILNSNNVKKISVRELEPKLIIRNTVRSI